MSIQARLFPIIALSVAIALSACSKPTNEGEAQRAAGNVEEAVGDLTGNQSLKTEGQKDQVVGGVKDAASDIKEAAKDAVN